MLERESGVLNARLYGAEYNRKGSMKLSEIRIIVHVFMNLIILMHEK
jgi:hypothetical protein